MNIKIRSTRMQNLAISRELLVYIPVSKVPVIPENWQDMLLNLVVSKCRKENIEVYVIDWQEVKKALKITAARSGYGAVGGSAIGAGVGQ